MSATAPAQPGPVQPGPASNPVATTDPALHDAEVHDEIELYGELVIAASANDGPLSSEQLDGILGLGGRQPGR